MLPPGWLSDRVVDACLAFPRLAMRCPESSIANSRGTVAVATVVARAL